MIKKYEFKAYSDQFPKLFDLEKKRLLQLLDVQEIQHIGSTAIKGLGGKGIIDIAILVDHKSMLTAAEQLKQLGYLHREDHSTLNRWFFRADLPDKLQGMRRYHIHVMFEANEEWKNFILFRDYLNQHPDVAKEYAFLKEEISRQVGEDGQKYRQLKDPFFKKVITKAKQS